MLAIKKARKFIQSNPSDSASQFISSLVLALESEGEISVAQLYKLDYQNFQLAMEILSEWRLDRYYASKLRLLDASTQANELNAGKVSTASA
jgi:hypothetical protein